MGGVMIAVIAVELLIDFRHVDAQRLVDDQPHGAIFAVITYVSDGVRENGLVQTGHGNQEVIAKVAQRCLLGVLYFLSHRISIGGVALENKVFVGIICRWWWLIDR